MPTPTQKLYQYVDSLLTFFRVGASLRYGLPKTPPSATGKVLHVLANGPSLKSLDTTNLIGDKLALNLFASTDVYVRYKPVMYVLLSPAFWPSGETNEPGKAHLKTLHDLVEKTTWPVSVFVPRKSGQFIIDQLRPNAHLTVIPYADTPVEGLTGLCHFLYDRQLGMPRPHNVLIPSIMLGIWSKYEQLNLYGVDHSWIPLLYVDEHNNALLEQKHFYDEGKTKARPMPIAGNRKGSGRKVHEILGKWYLSFRAYHLIARYAEKQGVRIVNCTKGSFIDAFTRQEK